MYVEKTVPSLEQTIQRLIILVDSLDKPDSKRLDLPVKIVNKIENLLDIE